MSLGACELVVDFDRGRIGRAARTVDAGDDASEDGDLGDDASVVPEDAGVDAGDAAPP